jgi:aminopeptidase N
MSILRPSRSLLLAAVAVTVAASVSATAQQPSPPNPNRARMLSGVYTRAHDYDLVHQRIAVRDFNWDSTSFAGSVTTTLVTLSPGLDSVILDAGHRLVIRSVTAQSGAALRHSEHGDTLVIHLGAPAALHATVRFTIDYDGHIDSGNGLTFITERLHTPRQIWSQGEDHDNHFWFPTYDFPNDKMTWEVDATVPSDFVAVSNGRLVSDTRDAGGHTMRWSQDAPSATYLVSLVVAPLARVHDTWKSVPVDYYVYHQDSALAEPLFRVTPDMINTYSTLTGVPYPWAKYAQTTVADFFGGMENVSATTLVDWLPDARAYRDQPWYQHILIPHELAHQWFGDYVTTENWANMWLNEGFAEFMPGQYWGRKTGPKAEEDYYTDEYRQFMAIERRRPMPLASLGSNNIYPKGALVLEMLKEYLGPAPFWAGVHKYLIDHAFGTANSNDLLQAMNAASGQNLDWFWNEWVYSAGYPAFTVQSNYDSTGHRVTLVVTQTQRDSLAADSTGLRYVIPEAFRMPAYVRVDTDHDGAVRTGWLEHRTDTIVVDKVSSAPTMIVFDPGNSILKSLTFDQPTAWLATQLRKDENLWDREWVIGQLAKRPADGAAAAALTTAATGADHPAIRAAAASALAEFPRDAAMPALTAALRDTSSRVRTAAVASLAAFDSRESAALARAAWRSDSSYDVRAAALNALVRLDSAGRRTLIAEGLTTPSYHDEIQDAALAAIAQTNDRSFDDRLQRMMGDQQLVSQVFAVLGRRGDQRAVDLLVADLADSHAYVRQWAVGAIASMPKDIALTTLRAAQPTLSYPDTRRAVDAAVARLTK